MALALYLIGVVTGLLCDMTLSGAKMPLRGRVVVALLWPLVAVCFIGVNLYDKVIKK